MEFKILWWKCSYNFFVHNFGNNVNHFLLPPAVNTLQQQSHDCKAVELSELEARFKTLQFGGGAYWAAEMPAVHFCVRRGGDHGLLL